jgi:hypothetical protein
MNLGSGRLSGLLLGVLFVAAALNIGLALVALPRPEEVRYGEAILYEQAGRLPRGEALHQPLTCYVPDATHSACAGSLAEQS